MITIFYGMFYWSNEMINLNATLKKSLKLLLCVIYYNERKIQIFILLNQIIKIWHDIYVYK